MLGSVVQVHLSPPRIAKAVTCRSRVTAFLHFKRALVHVFLGELGRALVAQGTNTGPDAFSQAALLFDKALAKHEVIVTRSDRRAQLDYIGNLISPQISVGRFFQSGVCGYAPPLQLADIL